MYTVCVTYLMLLLVFIKNQQKHLIIMLSVFGIYTYNNKHLSENNNEKYYFTHSYIL